MVRLERAVALPGASPSVKKSRLPYFITGLVLILALGVAGWFMVRPGPAYHWQRFLRTEANYAIEFPGTPSTTTNPEQTAYGQTTMQVSQFVAAGTQTAFTVHFSPFPANSPFQKMTAEQAEQAQHSFIARLAEKLDGAIQGNTAVQIPLAGSRARDFEVHTSGAVYHGRLIFMGGAQYHLSVLAPEKINAAPLVKRFFNSWEYRGPTP